MWRPYKGLNHGQIQRVKQVRPLLEKIEEVTGVPWQAMLGIWYRESFSQAPPKTPGGPWQFDPIPSRGTQKGLLDRFTQLSDSQKHEILEKGVNDFYSGGVLAACFLRTKTRPVIHPGVADQVIKDAIYGYNGRAYGSADRSPYVMNGYDAQHFPMRLVGTIPDGRGGRISIDKTDQRPGAFTIYRQLKELFPNV